MVEHNHFSVKGSDNGFTQEPSETETPAVIIPRDATGVSFDIDVELSPDRPLKVITRSQPPDYMTLQSTDLARELTRTDVVRWLMALFTATIVFSGGMAAYSAFNPDVDITPVKEWTTFMIATQVPLLGTALAFYFKGKKKD